MGWIRKVEIGLQEKLGKSVEQVNRRIGGVGGVEGGGGSVSF